MPIFIVILGVLLVVAQVYWIVRSHQTSDAIESLLKTVTPDCEWKHPDAHLTTVAADSALPVLLGAALFWQNLHWVVGTFLLVVLATLALARYSHWGLLVDAHHDLGSRVGRREVSR